MSPAEELERLIDQLHEERLRVWSIVITFFGDAIVPRGGEVWLGVVASLMERLRINPGTLGAAMSRLTADRWLVREKVGRTSRYRLDEAGKEAFDAAARRVYGLDSTPWTGGWSIRWSDQGSPEAWQRAGFGSLAPGVFLRPEQDPEREAPGSELRLDASLEAAELPNLAARCFPLQRLEAEYEAFLGAFRPLNRALRDGPALEPGDAIAARTLLIHDYRRRVLREPHLPERAHLSGTRRAEARRLVAELYQRLLGPSEAWLSHHPESALTEATDGLQRRFGIELG